MSPLPAPLAPPRAVASASTQTTAPRTRRLTPVSVVGTAAGVLTLVAVWALASQHQPELILPSPVQTWDAFVDLLGEDTLVPELGRTMGRALTGVGLAFLIGVVWGAITGRSRWLAAFTQPALSTLMALPPVVLVALGMVWLGPKGAVTRLVVTFVGIPLIMVAVKESVRAVDVDLIEMARTFELSRWATIRHVIAPGIASPLLAATSVTVGQALRVAVMAELLSANDGVGAEVALARTNLNTADLFAWALVLVVVVIVIETVLLRPITNRLLRWQTTHR